MYVVCKKCGVRMQIPAWPSGSNSLSNVHVGGNVNVGNGGISFGPGGSISFGPGGMIGFGGPPNAQIPCGRCGGVDEYRRDEVRD